MQKFKIFFSWQSDLQSGKTKNFVRNCIDDAIAQVRESEAIEAVRDEATSGMTGSPNIVNSIFSKIDDCDMFIADLSLCFSSNVDNTRKSPNPNVLLELGYAVKTLGWERIICLCNTDFGDKYPFDIAHNRITPFALEENKKREEMHKISEIIAKNIQEIKNKPPRIREGVATYIIGKYNFASRKVEKEVVPVDLDQQREYIQHNEALINKANRLINEIDILTRKINEEKNRIEDDQQYQKVQEETDLFRLQDGVSSKELLNGNNACARRMLSTETPAVWRNVDKDKILIKSLLGISVDDDFFNLGELKKVKSILSGEALQGTKEEKDKYEKLEELEFNLIAHNVRVQYLETFRGLCFVPLAIQNISFTQDTNISVCIIVETGEPIEPDEGLLNEECREQLDFLCSSDDEDGAIYELFHLSEDGNIHVEEDYDGVLPDHIVTQIPIPIVQEGYCAYPSKTEDDYRDEIQEYIAIPSKNHYYEFEVGSLRPNECMWLPRGILIKPVNGEIRLQYRIISDFSKGDLKGILELRNNI